MKENEVSIVFVDNAVHTIFKTVESLKRIFENVIVFNQETDLFEFLETSKTRVLALNLDLKPNDGLTILREVKQKYAEAFTFIIVYSDKQDDFVQEMAYEMGVDAFVNFHNKASVMVVFLKNMLRRGTKAKQERQRNIVIDKDCYLVYKSGVPHQLPRKEFNLFELLYTNPGKFFSKAEIAERIWKDAAVARRRTIDVHIYNIRQFLGKQIIQSQKGNGYGINAKLLGMEKKQSI